MATIFSHPAVALGFSPLFSSALQSKTVLLAGIILTIFPDIDVIGFRLGIPYEHILGHRGITHSLFFSVIFSGLVVRFHYVVP
jgi:inner membrane protein